MVNVGGRLKKKGGGASNTWKEAILKTTSTSGRATYLFSVYSIYVALVLLPFRKWYKKTKQFKTFILSPAAIIKSIMLDFRYRITDELCTRVSIDSKSIAFKVWLS